jgi:hypothetical protein
VGRRRPGSRHGLLVCDLLLHRKPPLFYPALDS